MMARSSTDLNRQSMLSLDQAPHSPAKTEGGDLGNRMSKSRSVFGIDPVWEREMAKLKLMQEAQAKADAQKAAQDALEGKGKKKGKGKAKVQEQPSEEKEKEEEVLESEPEERFAPPSPIKRAPVAPPQLSLALGTSSVPHLPALTEDMPRMRSESAMGMGAWSDSDDDEPREKVQKPSKPASVEEDSEDEDVPLSRLKITKSGQPDGSDSEEDVPLSRLKPTRSATSAALPSLDLPSGLGGLDSGSLGLQVSGSAVDSHPNGVREEQRNGTADESDDDDVPLGLSAKPRDEDDDMPLAFTRGIASQRQSSMYPSPRPMGPYGPPAGPFGYPDPNLMSAWMYGMGYAAAMGTQAGQAGLVPGMGAMPMPSTQRVDSWRQEVAIAPGSSDNTRAIDVL